MHLCPQTQRTMQNQINEMKIRLSQSVHNHSDERDQLSEANNKISQASLVSVELMKHAPLTPTQAVSLINELIIYSHSKL